VSDGASRSLPTQTGGVSPARSSSVVLWSARSGPVNQPAGQRHEIRIRSQGSGTVNRPAAGHEPLSQVADFLKLHGYAAVHWSSVGEPNATDEAILRFCRHKRCCLVTNHLDFPTILARTRDDGPSVIVLRGEPLTPEQRGFSLCRAIQECQAQLEQGAILSIDWSDQPRARLLPLQGISRREG
jgi:predicted nuclease of predicted toxin-antitoxin system